MKQTMLGSASRRLTWHKAMEWCGWASGGSVETAADRRDAGQACYTAYELNNREMIIAVVAGSSALYAAIYLFYHSVAVSCLFAGLGLVAPRFRKRTLLKKRRQRLKLQFKEALFSLTSSLAAGRSLENAFRATLEDLRLLYTDPGTDILHEFQIICYRLENSDSLEQALSDFAERAQMEEISGFADTLSVCKRTGGNLLEVMKRTSTIIGEKLGVEGEIAVMLAQKRLEAHIMMTVPFIFLGFLGFAAADYMAPLYSGFGYVLLTGALILLLACFWLINRMMRIEI
ncbi:type II secretion system F family protein [Paenibacillus sp. HB172176]|uniref:type II secretion system F family protein n=1 Tax=Paenibacillus sp. HB172176 TaxID=2493690 RepID=UPI001F10F4E1|nr:type II secretion system F family protein [Paenibacillus sp. HB172176]